MLQLAEQGPPGKTPKAGPHKKAPEGCVCPALYAPVCAASNRTFSNACQVGCRSLVCFGVCSALLCTALHRTALPFPRSELDGPALLHSNTAVPLHVCHSSQPNPALRLYQAACNKLKVLHKGPCSTAPLTKPTTPVVAKPPPVPAKGTAGDRCICFALWAPVCVSGNTTLSNSCQADCQGLKVLYQGECGGDTALLPKTSPPPPVHNKGTPTAVCICTAIYAPVCISGNRTLSNACEAKCQGQLVLYQGECTPAAVGR